MTETVDGMAWGGRSKGRRPAPTPKYSVNFSTDVVPAVRVGSRRNTYMGTHSHHKTTVNLYWNQQLAKHMPKNLETHHPKGKIVSALAANALVAQNSWGRPLVAPTR